MISEIGFRKIVLLTDNRIKKEQFESVSVLSIERKETGTFDRIGNRKRELGRHLREKSDSKFYY
jgi:hypothetical protein